MINVGLIVDDFKPSVGGPYTILKETKKALSKKKIHIEIVSKSSNIKKKLKEVFKKFDICHFYGGWTFYHIKTFIIALRLKKKIIIHPLGYYEPWSLSQKKIKKKIAWNIYQNKIL